MRHLTINDGATSYKRISKQEARRRFRSGERFAMCPVNSHCSECADECRRDDMIHSECPGCAPSTEGIHEYNYDVMDKLSFLGEPGDDIYYGVEVEICTHDDPSTCYDQLGNDYICIKEDISLDNGGYEIVTAPASIDIHTSKWHSFFKKVHSHHDIGYGMHVHFSRKPIHPLTIGKMIVFYNKEDNYSFMSDIAGREPNTYCINDSEKTISSYNKSKYRREMINTINDDTYEVRIFQSPTCYDDFMSNLEFVQASIYFCRLTTYENLNAATFCEYVMKNKSKYPHLWKTVRAILESKI